MCEIKEIRDVLLMQVIVRVYRELLTKRWYNIMRIWVFSEFVEDNIVTETIICTLCGDKQEQCVSIVVGGIV